MCRLVSNIGENRPSRVRADVTINVKVKDPVRREWEGVSTHYVPSAIIHCLPYMCSTMKHDVCFLLW